MSLVEKPLVSSQVAELLPDTAESSQRSGDSQAILRSRDSQNLAEVRESGGPEGPDPTRYGDWERAGRCIDF